MAMHTITRCAWGLAGALCAAAALAAPMGSAQQVSAGANHSCATTSAGAVKCWGYNGNGQVGDGSTTSPRLRPVDVLGLSAGMKQVSAAPVPGSHSCAISNAGAAFCWGSFTGSGNPVPLAITDPQAPGGLMGAFIAAGGNFSCAGASPSGAGIRCWGFNTVGQLGRGGTDVGFYNPPAAVLQNGSGSHPLSATQLSASFMQACAVTGGGTVECWGNNLSGVLGRNEALPWLMHAPVPAPVRNAANSPIGGVRSVSVGDSHACAVTLDNTVLCWGSGGFGQLGGSAVPPSNNASQNHATPVLGLNNVKDVAVGNAHACAVLYDGQLKCWGNGQNGKLGRGPADIDNLPHLTPQPVLVSAGVALQGAKSVSAGHSHSCAVLNSGQVLCWGANSYGQLGDGTTDPRAYARALNQAPSVDLNADGHADLLWRQTASGTLQSWRMNGLTRVSDATIGGFDPAWTLDGVADFNRDGHPDLVWRTPSGDAYVHHLVNGVQQSTALLFNRPLVWAIHGVADFNADGKPDLLMRHAQTGNAFVWYFDGNAPVADAGFFNIDPVWKVEGIGDFNQDGQPDLLFRHTVSGLGFVWYTHLDKGALSLGGSSPAMFTIDPVWEVAQVDDRNGDGQVDLLFRNRHTGVVLAWYLDGATLGESAFVVQIDPSWAIVPRR